MQTALFDRLLCPVDFSELSGHALRLASSLALIGSGKIVAAYADSFEAPAYFTEGRVEELKTQFAESLHVAERSLREFVESAVGGESAPVETRVVEGLPVDSIINLAKDLQASAIVMGTHGRTGYNRWMLGSVAERVLRESPVPVLTVRGPVAEPIRHILCPVSDTEVSRQALGVATEIAPRLDATVTALHVQEPHGDSPISNLCSWITADQRARCNIRELVRHGDAAEEIVAAASQEPYDLIVLGGPRRRFFEGMLFGATALRVVRHAPCPVLTVGGHSQV